jgi:hypothetical protein
VGHPSQDGVKLASQAKLDTSNLVARVDAINKDWRSLLISCGHAGPYLLSHLDSAIKGVRQLRMQQPISGSLTWAFVVVLFSPGCMRSHSGVVWGIC